MTAPEALVAALQEANRQFMSYPVRGRQALDDAVAACRAVLADPALSEPRTRGLRVEATLLLAAALIVRYQRVYEHQLLPDLPPHVAERIGGDIRDAIEVLSALPGPDGQRVEVLTALGFARTLRAEIDNDPGSHDEGIALLRRAVATARGGQGPGEPRADELSRIAAADRLAAALITTGRAEDAREAVEILERLRHETPASVYQSGMLLSLASARTRAWMFSRDEEDVPTVRQGYLDTIAANAQALPFAAFTAATQWAGWASFRGAADESAVAYAAAMWMLRGLVAGEASREQKEEVIRSLPGVAANAAGGLARSGLSGAAVRCLEFGRAVLLADALDTISDGEETGGR